MHALALMVCKWDLHFEKFNSLFCIDAVHLQYKQSTAFQQLTQFPLQPYKWLELLTWSYSSEQSKLKSQKIMQPAQSKFNTKLFLPVLMLDNIKGKCA